MSPRPPRSGSLLRRSLLVGSALVALAACGPDEAASVHSIRPVEGARHRHVQLAGGAWEVVAPSPAQELFLVLMGATERSSPDPIPAREERGPRAPPPCAGSPDPIPVKPGAATDPKAIEAEEAPPCEEGGAEPCGCVTPAEDDDD